MPAGSVAASEKHESARAAAPPERKLDVANEPPMQVRVHDRRDDERADEECERAHHRLNRLRRSSVMPCSRIERAMSIA